MPSVCTMPAAGAASLWAWPCFMSCRSDSLLIVGDVFFKFLRPFGRRQCDERALADSDPRCRRDLRGSSAYDLTWVVVAILTLLAFLPIIVALVFTVWAATRPSVDSRRDAALRLRLEHASRRHAQACAGRGTDRRGAACRIIASSSPPTAMPRSSRRVRKRCTACCGGSRRATASRSMLWENIAGGLYRAETLPVHAGRPAPAGAGLYRAAAPARTAEARLYGDRGRGGARVGICRRLHFFTCSNGCRERSLGAGHRKLGDFVLSVHASCHHPRPRAGRRLSRLDRIHGARTRPARLGAQSPRRLGRSACSSAPEDVVARMIEACRNGPPGARVDLVDQREAGADELALRRRGELFSVLGTA